MEPRTTEALRADTQQAITTVSGLVERGLELLPKIGLALIVFVFFLLLAWVVRWALATAARRSRRHTGLGLAVARLAQWIIWLLGLFIALVIAIPSFRAGQLVELLGISSVAIGFAFRDILQNFLAGLLILVAEPFRLGDQIRYGTVEGTVEEIETRATVVRTYDGRRVVIPNAKLFTDTVTVNTAHSYRRTDYALGISYDADIARARAIVVDAVSGVEGVVKQPAPDAIITELGDSAVMLTARWWTDSRRADVLLVQDRVLEAILRAMADAGIDLPYPIQTVRVTRLDEGEAAA